MYNGRTTVEDQHRHRFMGATSEEPNTPRHTHIMEGNTEFRQGHRHYYRIMTGPPIPYGSGHLHYFYGITSINDGHAHYMYGYTRIYRRDNYRAYDDYYKMDPEYMDNHEE
jgi:hypothetical protein